MAMKRGRQTEWPRVKNEPETATLTGGYYQRSDRPVAGPLRMGTAPGAGPTGPAVIADYDVRSSDHGTDMIARDRKLDRKFPSDLIAREIRGPRGAQRENIVSEGKRFPK